MFMKFNSDQYFKKWMNLHAIEIIYWRRSLRTKCNKLVYSGTSTIHQRVRKRSVLMQLYTCWWV